MPDKGPTGGEQSLTTGHLIGYNVWNGPTNGRQGLTRHLLMMSEKGSTDGT